MTIPFTLIIVGALLVVASRVLKAIERSEARKHEAANAAFLEQANEFAIRSQAIQSKLQH